MPFCTKCGSHVAATDPNCPTCHTARPAAKARGGAEARREPEIPVDGARFDAVEELARGSMGVVYKARQKSLCRPVAVKVLHDRLSNHAEAVARFHREALALARLDHPNIVRVLDYFENPTNQCLVYEFVTGQTLASMMEGKPGMSPETAIPIVLQIVAGLRAAHALQIIHRDIKPANILVQEDGSVKITDFGVARMVDARSLTSDGEVVGTVSYMAPEQLVGSADVDDRADLFSVGVMLYEMLTAKLPFGGSKVGWLKNGAKPTPILDHLPRLDPTLAALIMRIIAKDPAERVQSAHYLFRELTRWVQFCRRCGNSNVATASLCRSCRSPLRNRPSQVRLAVLAPLVPRWRRGLAFLFDHLPLAVACVPPDRIPLKHQLIAVVAVLALMPFRDCLGGASPGKRLLRLRVFQGERAAGFLTSFVRNATFIPLYMVLLLAFLHLRLLPLIQYYYPLASLLAIAVVEAIAVVQDDRRRRIGDWLAHTEVRKR